MRFPDCREELFTLEIETTTFDWRLLLTMHAEVYYLDAADVLKAIT